MGLLVGTGEDRIDAAIERGELAAQGVGCPRLFGAQDGKPDRVEQVRLRDEHARIQHRAHAGVVGIPIDLDVGVCKHVT
ncbi:hypothetical protein QCM77_41710 [Bradyrhizobium sp. SSUT18]|uniref:hypothetical protein n=1 Tax=unclassified Bradyrhizobium TaxID=2631580 RepID=UPI002448E78B|nr:hypothetical protein [Bradyrhizobium sp. SSUT18]MDH2406345.1 hypothetical protein [Bradyrhizobium sp. SSUT18]